MGKPIDITGQRFGMLTVLSYEGLRRSEATSTRKTGYLLYMWRCRCECGREVLVAYRSLVGGHTQSCGCKRVRALVDITGKRFGRLTALHFTGTITRGRGRLWACMCDCGQQTAVYCNELNAGGVLSCGCLLPENRPHLAEGESAKRKLFYDYKRKAREKGREFLLSLEQFGVLTQENCFYCGYPPTQISSGKRLIGEYIYNGIDRIDNTKGYTIENTRTSCGFCNHAKATYSEQEFYVWIRRIVATQNKQQIQISPVPPHVFNQHGFKALYKGYKKAAKKANRIFSLDEALFLTLTQSLCSYCSIPPSGNWQGYIHTGIDRIDNTLGYTVENVKPCCR